MVNRLRGDEAAFPNSRSRATRDRLALQLATTEASLTALQVGGRARGFDARAREGVDSSTMRIRTANFPSRSRAPSSSALPAARSLRTGQLRETRRPPARARALRPRDRGGAARAMGRAPPPATAPSPPRPRVPSANASPASSGGSSTSHARPPRPPRPPRPRRSSRRSTRFRGSRGTSSSGRSRRRARRWGCGGAPRRRT